MLKLLILAALTIVILIQTVPAYCAVGLRTISMQVSATLPEHVMAYDNLTVTRFSSSPYQLVQTDTVIRNNQSFRITSIVVP
jgi:hypothetical protein